MHPDKLVKLIRSEIRQEYERLDRRRQAAFTRFPLALGTLVTVGAISTFTGLSKIIGNVEWLNRNPWVLLAFGVSTLAITGSLYKKLS